MDIRNVEETPSFITKDGSEIRQLLAPDDSVIQKQSLAEARLPSGGATTPHYHRRTEEIYFILEGRARMRVGRQTQDVGPGDAIAIPPGSEHQIVNAADSTLRFLCCCVPPYQHDDTVLVEAP